MLAMDLVGSLLLCYLYFDALLAWVRFGVSALVLFCLYVVCYLWV